MGKKTWILHEQKGASLLDGFGLVPNKTFVHTRPLLIAVVHGTCGIAVSQIWLLPRRNKVIRIRSYCLVLGALVVNAKNYTVPSCRSWCPITVIFWTVQITFFWAWNGPCTNLWKRDIDKHFCLVKFPWGLAQSGKIMETEKNLSPSLLGFNLQPLINPLYHTDQLEAIP